MLQAWRTPAVAVIWEGDHFDGSSAGVDRRAVLTSFSADLLAVLLDCVTVQQFDDMA